MAQYQGHRSWNSWNVSLWINNDEPMYRYARAMTEAHGRKLASKIMARELEGERTPDNARYNRTCIYEALEGITD